MDKNIINPRDNPALFAQLITYRWMVTHGQMLPLNQIPEDWMNVANDPSFNPPDEPLRA